MGFGCFSKKKKKKSCGLLHSPGFCLERWISTRRDSYRERERGGYSVSCREREREREREAVAETRRWPSSSTR
ncbi:hypothetical protein HanIR_Chr07g0311781 [Helianthus annuus]|nr:hypothetical protein HanIR_Chr07g0311781 [Helianthus annuus]